MKKILRFASVIAIMAITTFSTSSCNTDEDTTTIISNNLSTVRLDMGGRYTFYTDDDIIVNLDSESDNLVYSVFGSKAQRVSLIYQYKPEDATVVNGVRHISNAQVINGTQIVDVENIITKAEAEAKNQLAKDSIFEINEVTSFYAHKGYLNCVIKAPYSTTNNKSIYPGITLVVEQSDIKENEMTIHMYFNRHSSKDAPAYYMTSFAKSFPISAFANVIPGKEDINLKLVVEGQTTPKSATFKMTRSDFYLPF